MTAPFATVEHVDREALIQRGHHPLAFCEHCRQPVPEVRIECADPACQALTRARDLFFVNRFAVKERS